MRGMEIFLVRHGIAEDLASAPSDADRHLTSEGREKTERVAKAFRKRIGTVEVIFHSPYARAKETAEIFAKEFPQARLILAKGLTPQDSAKAALPLLSGFHSGNCVMIVGHEPHLSSLASLLVTGRPDPIVEVRKAGIVGIECEPPLHGCRINFLLSPKWL
jgi:phosphohistidine phosphatase